jgi:hypothetical protein
MSRLREEQMAAMSRLREEQMAAMSRLREEQMDAMSRPRGCVSLGSSLSRPGSPESCCVRWSLCCR